MIRPEIAGRIRETCDIGLKDWYKRNMQEVDIHYSFYADHPALKALTLEEAEYISEILKNRTECPYHHIVHA
jgi:hypothetical protein